MPTVHSHLTGIIRRIFIIWSNLPIQDTGYDFSSVMFVWDQKIRQFPVKDPTFRAFHPADDTDMTFMPFL